MPTYKEAREKALKEANEAWFDMLDRAKSLAASNDFRNSELRDEFIDVQVIDMAGDRSYEEFLQAQLDEFDMRWEGEFDGPPVA